MHNLLGDRQEQRKVALKMALRLADERAQGREPSQSSSDGISHSGFTPPSTISGLLPPRELSSAFPKASDSASDGSRGAAPSVGGMTTATYRWGILVDGRFSSGARLALAALGIALVVGLGFFAASRWASRAASSEATPIPRTAAPVAVTPIAQPPEEPPTAPAPSSEVGSQRADSVEASEKAPDAQPQAGPPKWAPRPPLHAPAKSIVAATQPSASPKPTSTTFVPPVRNPGF
jgi:hypothetical protein